MATIFIGDFRLEQLQYHITKIYSNANNYNYITESTADFAWFDNSASNDLAIYSKKDANVVIMLGFNDCLYSCIWSAFDVDTSVKNYIKKINRLVDTYPDMNFYVCTIPKIDADYPLAYSDLADMIPAKDINEKLDYFNNQLRLLRNITLIDVCSYLDATSFSTRDGLFYEESTVKAIYNLITNSITDENTSVTMDPIRDTSEKAPRPTFTDDDEHTDASHSYKYWTHTSAGGLNSCVEVQNGSVLPNCVGYAWGRFYEISGQRPKLSTGNAENWFNYNSDGYARGDTPLPGAVICWSKGKVGNDSDGAGHVAIVESVDNENGTIITSESGWVSEITVYNPEKHFWTTTRKYDEEAKNWCKLVNGEFVSDDWIRDYAFQGFIYNPAVTLTASSIDVKKEDVISHTGITSESEREINAKYICKYLLNAGWNINAIAGLLGNMEHESWLNPGVTEIGGSGFGLVQWTPPSKFTNWCNAQNPPLPHDDIDSQIARIEYERSNSIQYSYSTVDGFGDSYAVTFGPKKFEDFSTSTNSVHDLACAFLYNYEKPASIIWGAGSKEAGRAKTPEEREIRRVEVREKRSDTAEKWYKFFAPYALGKNSKDAFVFSGLKLDSISPTSIKVSFFVKNGKSGSYTLFDSEEAECDSGIISVNANTSEFQIITFEYIDRLTPNTSYKLKIDVEENKENGSTKTESIEFKTPQDYPKTIAEITLLCANKIKTADSLFELKVIKPEYLGYWHENSGYDKQLFVNGKCVKSIKITKVEDISKTFTIKEEFGYECKTGDVIQVGIVVWVIDNKGVYQYNNGNQAAKTSDPICILNRPVQAYINNIC